MSRVLRFDPQGPSSLFSILVVVALAAFAHPAAAQSDIEIPYEKFVLDNGLTLVVHEDRKAPIVAVNVWYHVGSKNEEPGRTGFAHLFEHLMFNGSEHYDDDYFQAVSPLGATDLNGTTNFDRTNYFQNVPTSALDVVLWMESDRMAYMTGAIDQAKLDEQRAVVQNEKRQRENQPYGTAFNHILESTHPEGHPYSWSPIGSMDDLNAATLDDVHTWFQNYYGAANAVVVIAGDIDPETALEKVEHYFGEVPPGPPVARPDVWVADRTGSQREVMEDRVPQARLYRVWNVPEWGNPEAIRLSLAADVLGSGETSRLYQRLVYEDRVASNVSASLLEWEIESLFLVQATVAPDATLTEVESALDEELHRFLDEGPTQEEVDRARTRSRASFVRGMERIGGFGGKSDILASNEVYGGSPDFYENRLEIEGAATPERVRETAGRWLSDGEYTLEVHPYPEYRADAEGADRTELPEPGDPPEADFPEFERATLSNGLRVVLAERRSVPVVDLRLLVNAGYAADHRGVPGSARLTLSMLDEGTSRRDALEIAEELADLGATLSTGSDLDVSTVSMSALTENLAPSLDLFADVVLNPAFPASDFELQRRQQLVRIRQEKAQPTAVAQRVVTPLLYGDEHPYAQPASITSGSGTEESLERLGRDDLERFHRRWFRPGNATLVVVGDTSLDELIPLLEERFGSWESGDVPGKDVGRASAPDSPVVYVLDRPDAQQSAIVGAQLVPPRGFDRETELQTMSTILGGGFLARLNMNLREDKGWSYGARTTLVPARGPRPLLLQAPVQSDRTAESLREMVSELTAIARDRPPTDVELERAKNTQTLSLAGRWETNAAVARSIGEIVRFDLEDDYFDRFQDRVRSLEVSEVASVASDVLDPERAVWVVVGDLERIADGILELGVGPVYEIDGDGRVLGEISGTAAD